MYRYIYTSSGYPGLIRLDTSKRPAWVDKNHMFGLINSSKLHTLSKISMDIRHKLDHVSRHQMDDLYLGNYRIGRRNNLT